MSPKKQITLRDQEVIKATGAIHMTTSRSLTLVERKLANILLKNAYQSLLTDVNHEIPMDKIFNGIGWEINKKSSQVEQSLKRLVNTTIEFNSLGKDKINEWMVCSFLSMARIKNGMCIYEYPSELKKLLFQPRIYARLDLLVSSKFKSKNAISLWEFLVEIISSSKNENNYTEWINISDYLEKVLCVKDIKSNFKEINRHFIKRPIKEINEVSNIEVLKIEFRKEGRKVVAIRFLVKRKKYYQPMLDLNMPMPIEEDLENDAVIQEYAKIMAKTNPDGYAHTVKKEIREGNSSIENIKSAVEKNKNKLTIQKELKQKEYKKNQLEKEQQKQAQEEYKKVLEELDKLPDEQYQKLKEQAIKDIKKQGVFFDESKDMMKKMVQAMMAGNVLESRKNRKE